jgi:hypothetical protein
VPRYRDQVAPGVPPVVEGSELKGLSGVPAVWRAGLSASAFASASAVAPGAMADASAGLPEPRKASRPSGFDPSRKRSLVSSSAFHA